MTVSRRITMVACLAFGAGVSTTASAHFKLDAPASIAVQDAVGNPQKIPPCGGPFTASNLVSTFQEGSMIDISITETVPHRGHYRVSIAQDIASLPADPVVTPGPGDCGSLAISSNPTMPLIADGLFAHLSAFSSPQTTKIQLPAGFTCTGCVLQVTEFMGDHAAPCFYHHCAAVTITAGPVPPDAGTPPGDDTPVPSTDPGGCCSTGRDHAASTMLLGALVAMLLRRRRRA